MSNPDTKEETFEEMESSNNEDELIEKKKKSKKTSHKLFNTKLISFIIINIIIIPILYNLYISYNKGLEFDSKYEISSNLNSGKKLEGLDLKLNKVINYTNDESGNNIEKKKFSTESIAQFPSGNIISADWLSIIIYDKDFNIKQRIFVNEVIDKKSYWKIQKKIYKIIIRDENNFAIYSNDAELKLYTKKGDEFVLKQEINELEILDVIFDSKNNMIACCKRNMIKIFEENEKGEYKSVKTIFQADAFNANIFEDKNLFISKSISSLEFYDLSKNFKLIETIRERSVHGLERYGNDKFIIYHNNTLKILSFDERKVIKKVEIGFEAFSVKYLEDKGIILVAGIERSYKTEDKSILVILRSDNFEVIKTIYGIHGSCVKGIFAFKNGLIATFGEDGYDGYPIKIWSLE